MYLLLFVFITFLKLFSLIDLECLMWSPGAEGPLREFSCLECLKDNTRMLAA